MNDSTGTSSYDRLVPNYSDEVLKNFIVFEGLDGAGSSTQAALLEANFRKAGRKVHLSHEPSSGPAGNLIKLIMKGRMEAGDTIRNKDRQLAYLFAADRHDHLYNSIDGIYSLTSRGFTAISTRYFFSSFAYNARASEDFDLVDRLNRDFPIPELIVYLTIPVEEAIHRLDQRGVRENYEVESELKRVAANYGRIFEPIKERVLTIESNGDVDVIASAIFEEVNKRLAAQ